MRLLPLLTAEETRRAEAAHSGSLDELMERAGTAVAELVLRSFPGRVTVVCGKGNNGGDGKICARVLREAGREVTLVEGSGDLGAPDVVVDALLGIGLEDAPREDASRMIDLINASGRPVVSIDVPSGVNASTGEISGAAVRATATVTFGAAKVGLAVAPGCVHAGAVTVAPLGLRPREHEHALVPASVLLDVPAKQVDSTKYSAGSVLVVGGSRGLTGALMLASLAAYPRGCGLRRCRGTGIGAAGARVGAARGREAPVARGLVRTPAAPGGRRRARGSREGRRRGDRARARPQRRDRGAGADPARAPRTAGRAGCRRTLGARAVRAQRRRPCSRRTPASSPGCSAPRVPEIDAHRLDAVRRAASRFGSVVLLKGADTLVAAPREGVLVASYGTPALATAGSGDVLTGIVAAFLAKGIEPPLAAAAAAVAHGVASELLEPSRGAVASDLLPALRFALAGHGLQRAPLAAR